MRDVLYDSHGDLTVEITRSQLEAWVGHKLTDDQVYELDGCIPDSSIPEAIDTIVHEAMGVDYPDEEDDAADGPPQVPADFPVQPLKPGQPATDPVTCGTCGRSWDDAIPTDWTPAPSGRCPFEYYH
jgi:hypothetical protein